MNPGCPPVIMHYNKTLRVAGCELRVASQKPTEFSWFEGAPTAIGNYVRHLFFNITRTHCECQHFLPTLRDRNGFHFFSKDGISYTKVIEFGRMDSVMGAFSEIHETIQRIAEAIASVLGIDVTIVDENLERVAGTGDYRPLIGKRVPKDSVFEQCLKNYNPFIIDQPRVDTACFPCESKEICPEYGTICTPILVDGRAMGVIGLVALNNDQKVQFDRKREDYLTFLNKMSNLISAKINEQKIFNDLVFANQQIETTIEAMSEGILTIDDSGRIRFLNRSAKDLLKIEKKEAFIGKHVRSVLPEISVSELFETGIGYSNQEIFLSDTRRTYHLLSSGTPMILEGKVLGAVITLKDFNALYRSLMNIARSPEVISFDEIIGQEENFLSAKEQARMAARSDSSILILGESGTGKELFARAVHSESSRSRYCFMAINCSAIPEQLLESELFGYEEGAFTGAKKGGKFGIFEVADGGTIFLDEIGDMPLHLQAKLLRFLEEKKILKLGGHRPKEVDTRLIASTNKNLEEMIQKGLFRSDLYYRLNVIPIRIPPLRERKKDVPLFVEFFLKKYNTLLHKKIEGFTNEVQEILLRYDWPGNVRELENSVEYAVNFETSPMIKKSALTPWLKDAGDRSRISLKQKLEKFQAEEIQRALRHFGSGMNGIEKAAQYLGISRATLYRRMGEFTKKG